MSRRRAPAGGGRSPSGRWCGRRAPAAGLLLAAATGLLAPAGSLAEEPERAAAPAAEAAAGEGESLLPPIFEIDDETRRIIRRLDAVGPYQVPDLEIRKDSLYAGTPDELAPYGGVEPFKRHFLEQMVYTGPGRAIPEPAHVESVKLGFIGPIMATVSVATGGASHEEELGIQMLRGSRLAVEEANARGGYTRRGIPFELVIKNDNGLWGASGNEIVDMAYKDGVRAILGTIDGANSHIAIRVALKAEVFMINTGDTDPTFIETSIPWVARVIGDDRQQGYLMVDYLYRKLGLERVGIIRASNRYGRFGVREIRDGSRRLGHPIVQEMAYQVGLEDFSLHLDRLRRAGAQAIVHWGDAREAALILNQMRREGMEQPFLTSDRAVTGEFVELAGKNAEGVMAGFPWDPTREDPALDAFRRRFRARFGVDPDTYAAHAYDGMNMLIWAVEAVGLNRAKIRDVIAYRPRPWPGVTGDIPLSAALDDVGEVTLAEFRGGKWRYRTREDLGIPGEDLHARDRSRRDGAGPGGSRGGGPGTGGEPPPSPGAGAAGAASRPRRADPDGAGEVIRAGRPGPRGERSPERPFIEARDHAAGYAGPGRETPDPEGLEEIRIAWFGPHGDAPAPENDPWHAALLAVEGANRAGGVRGLPLSLLPVWSEDPWGTGIGRLARTVYEENVVAVLGGVDGPSAHLAEQVVAKARLPLISALSGDESVSMANVAWTFTFMPPDSRQAAALAREILSRPAADRTVVVSAVDHDTRRLAARLLEALSRRGVTPRRHMELDGGEEAAAALAEEVAALKPPAVVILAGPGESAVFLRALRGELEEVRTYGSAVMGSRAFREASCASAEGTVFPRLCDPEAFSRDFVAAFRQRTGVAPGCDAAQTWDATRMLVEAIRVAGPNRARVRDAMASMSPAPPGEASSTELEEPWSGEAGVVRFDVLGRNLRPVRLATFAREADAGAEGR